ncbi:MAG TPA: hypothetical protein PKE19_00025 [Aestuariivirga sp.]|nr:hypothetical protein [Aestuariivirga sp.]
MTSSLSPTHATTMEETAQKNSLSSRVNKGDGLSVVPSPTPDGFYIAMLDDGPLEAIARNRADAIDLMWDATSYGMPKILHIIMAENRVTDVTADLAEEWLEKGNLSYFEDFDGSLNLPDWLWNLLPSRVESTVEDYRRDKLTAQADLADLMADYAASRGVGRRVI